MVLAGDRREGWERTHDDDGRDGASVAHQAGVVLDALPTDPSPNPEGHRDEAETARHGDPDRACSGRTS